MKDILYSNAYTQDKFLIKATDAQKNQSYTCPSCEREMILRKGGKKRPHFAHKALSPNCNPESVLHYSFKTLLCEKIQLHLDKKIPLAIQWNCACGSLHTGNLLKKATQVKPEQYLGTCKPDIALLDIDGQVNAVIEVVVSHFPEQQALDYYKQNRIVVIQYILKSDQDIERLNNSTLTPDLVGYCLNPSCLQCGKHMREKHLLIINASCWKCSAPMKVAALNWELDIDDFSEADIKLASQEDVSLKKRYSNTVRRSYIANTCKNCSAFIGSHYLFTNYVAMDHSPKILSAGYYCLSCSLGVD